MKYDDGYSPYWGMPHGLFGAYKRSQDTSEDDIDDEKSKDIDSEAADDIDDDMLEYSDDNDEKSKDI